MKIDKSTIKYIANLAMIEILEDEQEKYSKDLEQILTYAEILDEMDMTKLPEFRNPISNSNKFRKDEVKTPMDRKLMISNAAETQDGMFKVPKVIE